MCAFERSEKGMEFIMKKTVVIVILILILVALGSLVYWSNNKKMSKEDFIELMQSFKDVTNVKLESSTLIKYIKGQKALSVGKDGVYTWSNLETNESISWSPIYRTYSIVKYEDNSTGLETADYTFIRF